MKRKYHRIGFTAAQSAELWERWKKGEYLACDRPRLRQVAFLHCQPS